MNLIKCLSLFLLWSFSLVAYSSEPSSQSADLVELPPQSLALWYKPQNKRQVWLHTMFRLRQSMQAVDYYLQADNPESLTRWTGILKTTYAKLPKMVPEWEGTTRQGVAASLHQAALDRDYNKVAKESKRLQKFCDACHMEWQPLVSAIYRSPDYRLASVEQSDGSEPLNFPEMMQKLSATLGVLKITREDGDMASARSAASQLHQQLEDLGGSCQSCHKDQASYDRILGSEIQTEFTKLQGALHQPHDPKQSGRALGMIGFKVCGRCHSIHRNLGDLRNWLID